MAGFSKHDVSKLLHNFRCKLKKDISCCLADIGALLQSILDAIVNLNNDNQNQLKCSSAKACDADCQVVICHTCYDVEGAIVSTNHTNPDGTPYEGDLTTLDLGCVACGDPIPTFEIINIPVCFEDCTTGYNLIKVNTLDDSVTFINSYLLDGTVSESPVVECPEIRILEQTKCEI